MNPYIVSGPVTHSHMFYGYQKEAESIAEKVADRYRRAFVLVGGSVMGKTSLLLAIHRQLRKKDIHEYPSTITPLVVIMPFYIDMSIRPDCSLQDFFGHIAFELNRYLTRHTVPFEIPQLVPTLLGSVKTDREPTRLFADALGKLAQAALPYYLRIVLLIDDLWRRNQQRGELARSLRALYIDLSLEDSVTYVFTGSPGEYRDALSGDSPLKNVLYDAPLHVFDDKQSFALIQEPTERKIPQEVAQEVYKATGGHPFLLQYLMSELYEQDDWTQLTSEDVYKATVRFEKERAGDFNRWWWEKLSEADRLVYGVFCQQQQTSVDDLHSMMLSISTEGGRNLIMHKPMIQDSLRTLETMGLIRELEESFGSDDYELAGQWPARSFRHHISRNGSSLY